jgi:uncharacterized protein
MPSDKGSLLAGSPKLRDFVRLIDRHLANSHPTFFSPRSSHPVLPLKRSKVIHDNLWGTNAFTWRELAIIDSPIAQRLRGIHQVGLAFQVYPSARHSRFEHCLGVSTVASRVFDALVQRSSDIKDIARVLDSRTEPSVTISRLRQEVRLAALLHDTGHSLFSHASEKIYANVGTFKGASEELSELTGKNKGAGEVVSFSIALSDSLETLLARASRNLIGELRAGDYEGEIDLVNVALIIVGRSRHPYLQFLGDIVSSGFDADKLDYLYRDATAAGLPLRYDLDRYLYSVRLERNYLGDDEQQLRDLYGKVAVPSPERKRVPGTPFDGYEAYRLRLPQQAMNTIEQIVICKLMLFSYIYHHPKVRAAEGLLERMLQRMVELWRSRFGEDEIALKFLTMTDDALSGPECAGASDSFVQMDAYRLTMRLLPREVYRLSGTATHAQGGLLRQFLDELQDPEKRDERRLAFHATLGEEILRRDSSLGRSPDDALLTTGAWLDTPRLPKFEDIDDLIVSGSGGESSVALTQLFPINHWTDAYAHYRHYVRIFAFSEYWDLVAEAAKAAMKREIRIESEDFYREIKRAR